MNQESEPKAAAFGNRFRAALQGASRDRHISRLCGAPRQSPRAAGGGSKMRCVLVGEASRLSFALSSAYKAGGEPPPPRANNYRGEEGAGVPTSCGSNYGTTHSLPHTGLEEGVGASATIPSLKVLGGRGGLLSRSPPHSSPRPLTLSSEFHSSTAHA